jgi:hypothetical protein
LWLGSPQSRFAREESASGTQRIGDQVGLEYESCIVIIIIIIIIIIISIIIMSLVTGRFFLAILLNQQ